MAWQWGSAGMRSGVLVVTAVCGALAGTVVMAQQPAPQGNARKGEVLSYTCLGCHGVEDYRNAYPNYSVPELRGQHPEYLSAALQEYRDSDRAHMTMHAQATELSDQDIADIAAYFAGKPLGTDAKPQGDLPEAAKICTTCHGVNGVGITPQFPTLAGQHPDYLVQALIEYKKGGRKNPIMSAQAAQVKDDDMEVIADYFSKQRPALESESRPMTAMGKRAAPGQ